MDTGMMKTSNEASRIKLLEDLRRDERSRNSQKRQRQRRNIDALLLIDRPGRAEGENQRHSDP